MFWTWSERNYPLKNTKWQELPATQTSFLISQFFHNNYQENKMGKVTVEGFLTEEEIEILNTGFRMITGANLNPDYIKQLKNQNKKKKASTKNTKKK